ncbi:hypothetical protein ACFL0Q_05480 [Thermodesulfobacteriota bacterium]
MNKRSGKSVSFDAMVKFFMQYYKIPTRKDIDKLLGGLDRIEKLIKAQNRELGRRGIVPYSRKAPHGELPYGAKGGSTASDLVMSVIQAKGNAGASFASIKEKTGFEDKKLRNIIFRLNKLGRITRKSRGIYVA